MINIRSETMYQYNKNKKDQGTITSNGIYVPPEHLINHDFLNKKNKIDITNTVEIKIVKIRSRI